MRRMTIAIATCIALAGCGSKDKPSAQESAGRTYCKALQDQGMLRAPISQCIREFAAAAKQP